MFWLDFARRDHHITVVIIGQACVVSWACLCISKPLIRLRYFRLVGDEQESESIDWSAFRPFGLVRLKEEQSDAKQSSPTKSKSVT